MTTLLDKLNDWKRQLLDLSKRNRLLHFRETKRQTLRVEKPSIEEVFQRIVCAEKPMLIVGVDLLSSILLIEDKTDLSYPSRPQQTIKTKEIRFAGSPLAVATALYTLKSRSKVELEERGVNVLFFAFGFLHFFESDDSDDEIVSPLILVPVDLNRETSLEPYCVVPRDDDIVVNPTLQKTLEDQFRLKLPNLPDDEDWSIVDYLEEVRQAIASKSRWRVDEEVFLSIFSFMKLNMYRDLENGLSYAESSSILQALAGNSSLLALSIGDIQEIPAHELDKKVELIKCLQVLDADSSQQQAIELAKAGGSFVLQGPPGTGKSQTITNIIAELLGLGKTVLFVSEKAAALDVVHRRLTAVGLSDSCLALHSHKTKKRDIVQELGRVYSIGNEAGLNISFNYHRLQERRDALNEYVRELHLLREPLGKSVFQVESIVASLHEVALLPFGIKAIEEITLDRLESMRDSFARLSGSALTINTIEANPWRGSVLDGHSQEVSRIILQQLKVGSQKFKEVEQQVKALGTRLGIDTSIFSISRVEWLVSVAEALVSGPDFYCSWLAPDLLPRLVNSAREASLQHKAAQLEAFEVGEIFNEDLMKYDLDTLVRKIETEYHSFFSRLSTAYRKEIRLLTDFTKSGKKPKYRDIQHLVPIAQKLRDRRSWVENSTLRLAEQFGSWYRGFDTDWANLEASLAWTGQVLALFDNMPPEAFTNCIACVLANRPALKSEADAVHSTLAIVTQTLEEIESWFSDSATTRIILKDRTTTPLSSLSELCDALAESIEDLTAWTRLASAIEKCTAAGISDPTEVLQTSLLNPDMYVAALEKRTLMLWLDYWFGAIPVLNEFEATSHIHLIDEFRRLDADLKTVARRVLVSRLAERRPHPSAASMNLSSSQPTLLMKEVRKKRRHKPLRILFSEIPDLLLKIKPCMMMSPLSVGQFLPLGTVQFDAVVFDEASQVKPEDAVGAIMRGSQLIVVGDSKQLPPTSFFDVSIGDDIEEEEYYDDANAYESILDLCGTIGLPERMLEWHYRSRREGLIAFSNNFLYDNRLITFPSPVIDGTGTGIEFRYVRNGVYDRSRTRTNPSEVQEVLKVVQAHARSHPEKSLGVVAFSQAQMMAIDTGILRMCVDDPTLEAFFGNMHDEPFFVKNLENVQGDERDIIVFSVGYGRDSTEKLAMNFGPLNNTGGERRLNVAITRAREKVVLVSSIRGAELDLSRTNAEGVRLLKHYLDYAERGIDVLDRIYSTDENAEYGSLFEEQVANVLRAAGYRVDLQVGCSGYRIDLAVVHPEKPGQYAIGIECDGATYHSAATARERDRLREQVLIQLGWKLHRIWSTDWFKTRTKQVERLLSAVEAAIRNTEQIEVPYSRQEETVVHKSEDLSRATSSSLVLNTSTNSDYLTGITKPYTEYRPLRQLVDFYENLPAVKRVLLEIVDAEAPLHIDTAIRQVGSAWGMTRAGSTIRRICLQAVESCINDNTVYVCGDFIYTTAERPLTVRRNIPGGAFRRAVEIAPEEVAEAVKIVLKNQIKLSTEDLIVAGARVLGFDRTGTDVRAVMQTGINLLLKKGKAIEESGQVSIT